MMPTRSTGPTMLGAKLNSPKAGLIVAACASLTGCLAGPDYHRPSLATPAAFKEAEGWAPAHPADAADRLDWWTMFNDPVLNDLESRVAASNQTLAAAEAAYRQARALVAEQRAALFPTVSLSASPGATTHGSGPTTQSYSLGLGGTWEPDLWGRIRRSIENAKAGAAQSAALTANARLSAQLELAADYIQLRQLDEEERILAATVDAYRKTLAITQNKYAAGVVPKSDVLSAQSQLESTRANDTDLLQQRARVEHAIAVLVGLPPAGLTLAATSWTLAAPEIPAQLPSEMLQRRPDVAAAERAVAAASASIGVQMAAYYPRLSLTGQGEFSGGDLGSLLSASNTLWSVGASAAETVFDAGARHAAVGAAHANYDQAVANYRQTALSAFAQVEDNLVAQRVLGREQTERSAASEAADAAEVIARNQYQAGQVDYTAVVVAQSTALSARDALVQVEAARATAAVDLIVALGGGWKSPPL